MRSGQSAQSAQTAQSAQSAPSVPPTRRLNHLSRPTQPGCVPIGSLSSVGLLSWVDPSGFSQLNWQIASGEPIRCLMGWGESPSIAAAHADVFRAKFLSTLLMHILLLLLVPYSWCFPDFSCSFIVSSFLLVSISGTLISFVLQCSTFFKLCWTLRRLFLAFSSFSGLCLLNYFLDSFDLRHHCDLFVSATIPSFSTFL